MLLKSSVLRVLYRKLPVQILALLYPEFQSRVTGRERDNPTTHRQCLWRNNRSKTTATTNREEVFVLLLLLSSTTKRIIERRNIMMRILLSSTTVVEKNYYNIQRRCIISKSRIETFHTQNVRTSTNELKHREMNNNTIKNRINNISNNFINNRRRSITLQIRNIRYKNNHKDYTKYYIHQISSSSYCSLRFLSTTSTTSRRPNGIHDENSNKNDDGSSSSSSSAHKSQTQQESNHDHNNTIQSPAASFVQDEPENGTHNIKTIINHPLFHFRSNNLGLLSMNDNDTISSDNNMNKNTTNHDIFLSSTTLDSIRLLPEIDSMLSTTSSTSTSSTIPTMNHTTIQSLQRSAEIFQMMNNGNNNEYKAILALLAECYLQIGDEIGCIKTIQKLQQYCQQKDVKITTTTDTTSNNDIAKLQYQQQKQQNDSISIAQAKVYWLCGDYQSCSMICEQLLKYNDSNICARNGLALSRLLSLQSYVKNEDNNDNEYNELYYKNDDILYTIRDPFRMIINSIERQYNDNKPPIIPYVASIMNMGNVEMIYAEYVAQKHNIRLHDDVPINNAFKYWKNGIQILESYMKQEEYKQPQFQQNQSMINKNMMIDYLYVQLNCNMASGLLQMINKKDINDNSNDVYSSSSNIRNNGKDDTILIQQASEYAKKALSIYNTNVSMKDIDGYHRTLTLIAQCYVHSGGAVTAEGLYQSAIIDSNNNTMSYYNDPSNSNNKTMINPCYYIELRDAYISYSSLCNNWEKRESYSEQLNEYGNYLNTIILPKSWQMKSSIHTSLYFYTPNTFWI